MTGNLKTETVAMDESACPLPTAVGQSVQGRALGRGVFGIGEIYWDDVQKRFWCLADVGGMLATVQVNVRISSDGDRSDG